VGGRSESTEQSGNEREREASGGGGGAPGGGGREQTGRSTGESLGYRTSTERECFCYGAGVAELVVVVALVSPWFRSLDGAEHCSLPVCLFDCPQSAMFFSIPSACS
jgi:hypothetical protein